MTLNDFDLIQDPFAIVPDGPVDNWAGRDELRDDLMDIMLGVRASDIGSTEFFVLLGELGAGKSHALLYLKTQIEKPKGLFNSLVVYVERPRVSSKLNFKELQKYIFSELGRDKFREICRAVKSEIDAVIDDLADAAGLRDTSNKSSFEEKAISELKKHDQSMAKLLRYGADDDGEVYEYLSQERASDNFEYGKKIDSDFIASKVLGDFFRVITTPLHGDKRVCESVYLFVDECEILFDAKATESDPVFSGLRELINVVPYNFGLVLSFSAATALLEAYMPQHLLKRMTHDPVMVEMLGIDEAVEFLRKQINYFRPEGSQYSDTFYPFSREAIEFIVERRNELTPRNLFMDCRRVLERSIRRYNIQRGDEIDRDLAEKILL